MKAQSSSKCTCGAGDDAYYFCHGWKCEVRRKEMERVDIFPDGWGKVMTDMPPMTEAEAQEFLKDIAEKKRQS